MSQDRAANEQIDIEKITQEIMANSFFTLQQGGFKVYIEKVLKSLAQEIEEQTIQRCKRQYPNNSSNYDWHIENLPRLYATPEGAKS